MPEVSDELQRVERLDGGRTDEPSAARRFRFEPAGSGTALSRWMHRGRRPRRRRAGRRRDGARHDAHQHRTPGPRAAARLARVTTVRLYPASEALDECLTTLAQAIDTIHELGAAS